MGLERLAAGVIVIGLILWGASILATPDEAGELGGVDPVADMHPDPLPDVDDVPPDEPDDDAPEEDDAEADDEEERDGESGRGKGKKGGG